ncbi:MAG: DUF4349 domain-containing protein [Gemmataceae bacterium]
MKRLMLLSVMLALAAALGCGSESKSTFEHVGSAVKDPAGDERGPAQPGDADGRPDQAQPPQRKVIYRAQVELIVEDFDTAKEELTRIADATPGAYISKWNVQGSPGTPRYGSWVVRVPLDDFKSFLAEVSKLGELQREQIDSQDITDQYYDLQSRMRSNEVAAKNFLDQLAEARTFDQNLALQREIHNLRREIDAQKGQINLWDNQVSLTTITITLQERKGYKPPESPSFGTMISRTFHNSIDALFTFGKGLVLMMVALAPWLPVFLIVGVPGWLLLRKAWRALTAPAQPMLAVTAGAPAPREET